MLKLICDCQMPTGDHGTLGTRHLPVEGLALRHLDSSSKWTVSAHAEFEKEAVKAETAGSLLKARAQRARKAEEVMRQAEAVQQRVQAVMKA